MTALCWLIAASLWVFAVSKLAGGGVPGSLLEHPWMRWSAAFGELAIGMAVVLPRWRRYGLWSTLVFAAAVMLMAGSRVSCGCGGPWLEPGPRTRLAIGCLLAAAACWCLARQTMRVSLQSAG